MSQSNVAFAIDKYAPFIGGAERQAQLLAGLLSARLVRCDVYTAQPDARSDAAAVGVRRLGTPRRDRLRHPVNFAAALRAFLAIGPRYSVVQGHALSGLACGAVVAARLRGCATAIKICSVGPDGDIAKITREPFGRPVWRMVSRWAHFIVPTPSLVPEVVEAGVAPGRIAVIPNALPPDTAEPPGCAARLGVRARLGLPERPIVLFVGRLSPEKGLDLLVRAWSRVPRDCDAILVVIGEGALAEQVAEWIRRSGLADRVRLVGAQLDVDPFYRAADVLAVPSRSETFGNALAEAMVHGLPVVTTPVGLANHWIRHGDNGLIVRGEGEMAAALEQLICDAPLRHRLGSAARRQALACFSPDAVVEHYLDLYARLTTGAGRPPRG